MITDAILSALFGILNAFINLFPEGDAFNFVGTEYVTHPALDMLSLANLFFPSLRSLALLYSLVASMALL